MTKTIGALHKQQHPNRNKGKYKNLADKTTSKQKSIQSPKLFEHHTKIEETTPQARALHE